MRVSPPKVFPRAAAAPRPPAGSDGADPYRQTAFLLGDDVDAVVTGLNLEGEVAAASSGARFRKQPTAAGLSVWSRAWLCRIQALHAVQLGNYAAAAPLIRSAADYAGAWLYLLQTSADEWQQWLDADGIALAAEQHATSVRLHPFRAAEALAANEVLGRVYRQATDLSLSHFGATFVLAASGSAPDHIEATFGDRDFHLALAQVLLGWLLELSAEHLALAANFPDVFGAPDVAPLTAWRNSVSRLLASADRCRIETIEVAGESRYLISNWRREPRAAARRLLL